MTTLKYYLYLMTNLKTEIETIDDAFFKTIFETFIPNKKN